MPIHITDHSFSHNSSIYHGGRGGAGNYRKISPAELVSPLFTPLPAKQQQQQQSAAKVFFGGRGGRGNAYPSSERAMFSFDEELERDRLMHENHAPVYSIGRGGMGNLVGSSGDYILNNSMGSSSPSTNASSSSAGIGISSAHSSPRSINSTCSSSSHGMLESRRFSAEYIKYGADRLWDRCTSRPRH